MKQLENSGIPCAQLGKSCSLDPSVWGPWVPWLSFSPKHDAVEWSSVSVMSNSIQLIGKYAVYFRILSPYNGWNILFLFKIERTQFQLSQNVSGHQKSKTFTSNPSECGWCYTTLILPSAGYFLNLFLFLSFFWPLNEHIFLVLTVYIFNLSAI